MNKINKTNQKIKVMSTSTSCLDYYSKTNTNIDLIRIKIYIDNKEYIDGKTIKADEFYNMMNANNKLVIKTSQPSVGELIDYFENLVQQGYKKIFITTISKKLSGSYNAICQAKKQLNDKIEIIPYNTDTVCFSEGYFALETQRLLDEGSTLTEVIEHLDFLKKNNTIFFVVKSLTQLIKNGRLTKKKGFIGRLLRINPILQVNENGEIVLIGKKFTIDSSFTYILEKIKKYTMNKKFLIHILTTGNPHLKTKFKTFLEKELNLNNILEIPSSPAIGAHVGNDVLGVGIILLKS
ncbi:DegV family protein [Candidatus Phytoplasma fraxini]|uniref:DegV family protein n=1 Tax=Ash yellows phytoplasma TaxID=35780 RepID=A0ABZ2UCB3_ASHYP